MTKTTKSKAAKPTKPKKLSKEDAPKERPNDTSTRPNDSASDPNDQPNSERTIGESERTIENEGNVLASQAPTIPLSLCSDDGPPRSDEPIPRSGRMPNSSVLARKASELMEWLYLEAGFSVAEIGKHFRGLSKSTVYERIRHLAEDPEMRAKHDAASAKFHAPQDPNATQPHPNGASFHPNAPAPPRSTTFAEGIENPNDDGEGLTVPRVNSEIYGPRPAIIEDNDGHANEQQQPPTNMGDGSTVQTLSSPLDMDLLRILARDPRWVDVYLAIRAGARQAGVADPVVYFNRHMWQDSRDMELVRTLIPYDPERPESLMENLEIIARKANFLDEATKRSGLTAEPQPQQQKGVKA